ncbi:MAG TPA: hypothetical protein VHB25_08660 [Gemmatimonadaceae bacterium]|nr:hypothetical protein [Gemmatimonadaceae bacterium]
MQLPDVTTSIQDAKRNNLFHVRAYRTLTYPELVLQLKLFYNQRGNKKYLKRGREQREFTILSLIGANGD